METIIRCASVCPQPLQGTPRYHPPAILNGLGGPADLSEFPPPSCSAAFKQFPFGKKTPAKEPCPALPVQLIGEDPEPAGCLQLPPSPHHLPWHRWIASGGSGGRSVATAAPKLKKVDTARQRVHLLALHQYKDCEGRGVCWKALPFFSAGCSQELVCQAAHRGRDHQCPGEQCGGMCPSPQTRYPHLR